MYELILQNTPQKLFVWVFFPMQIALLLFIYEIITFFYTFFFGTNFQLGSNFFENLHKKHFNQWETSIIVWRQQTIDLNTLGQRNTRLKTWLGPADFYS